MLTKKTNKEMKNGPCITALFSVAVVVIFAFYTNFGTFMNYGARRNSTGGLVIAITAFLLVMLLKKDNWQIYGNVKMAVVVAAFIICLLLTIVIVSNASFYKEYWYNIGIKNMQRSDCPSIRWDIWNIIGQKYTG